MSANPASAPDGSGPALRSAHPVRRPAAGPGGSRRSRLESPAFLILQGFLLGTVLMFTLHPFAEDGPVAPAASRPSPIQA